VRLRVVVASALALVALGSVAAAWSEDPPELTADDAAHAAEDAFEDSGLDASLRGEPFRTTYATRNRSPVDVWSVLVSVRDELVQVQLARSGAHPVAIDDRSLDGSSYVLSDVEYESVARQVDDPALARAVRRNVAVTLAAVLVIALSLGLTLVAPTMEGP
jgi:hypothetical protein